MRTPIGPHESLASLSALALTFSSIFITAESATPADSGRELDLGGHRNPDGQGFAAFGRVTHGMELVRMEASPLR